MEKKLKVNVSTTIDAPLTKVWQALTDPEVIKQYLFGTNTKSDWIKGSSITYEGVWEGKPYKDKGVIVDIVPGKLLHTTYYSPLGGKDDLPENYANVIYTLEPQEGKTIVSLSQDNIDNEAGVKHMEKNWNAVLGGMKKVLESKES